MIAERRKLFFSFLFFSFSFLKTAKEIKVMKNSRIHTLRQISPLKKPYSSVAEREKSNQLGYRSCESGVLREARTEAALKHSLLNNIVVVVANITFVVATVYRTCLAMIRSLLPHTV